MRVVLSLLAAHCVFTADAEAKQHNLDPIFIHGMERANTTYWWNVFRRLPEVLAFNEPFNPEVSARGRDRAVHWDSATLRHNFLNRDPLAEYGDVGLFPKFHDLIPYREFIWDPTKSVPAVKDYFDQLIRAAQARGKIPVFKLNRAFLRIPWFKANFGGTHLYLHRDLGALMNSYYSFRGTYGYFLRKFISVIGLNSEDRNFGEIAEYLGVEHQDVENAAEAHLVYGKKIGPPNKIARQKMTDAIGFLWLLGLSTGVKHADLVVDNEVLTNESERHGVVESIRCLTGLATRSKTIDTKTGDIGRVSANPSEQWRKRP